ncbi:MULTISPECIES: GGDEF domain-containing protein [Clostridium]|uniref:GGDEF domain-containing protein n=1 Tax=Clostridium frigoriphilum TaxID=443253 RepID=A0ABU7UT55_9CLOT|nr:GGDEF domain-containing protein [Clostridium sp. DSM 17811]MBU3100603.1 GGDEF domain-containing protein [Clostridium sp. DSM 17811]
MDLLFEITIALLNTLLNHTMLTRKKSVTFCVVTFVINSAIVMAALNGLQHFKTNITLFKYGFYFIMFLYIVYIYLVFKESLAKKLFVMFSTWVISAMIFIISVEVAKLFSDYEFLLYFEFGIIFLLQTILLLFLARPWFRENYRRILLLVQDNTVNLMSIYMIIAFLLLVNNTTVMDIKLRNLSTVYDLMLLFVFIILGYVIVFTGISSSSKNVLLQQSVEIAEKRSEINFKIANFDALTGADSRLSILNKITEAIIDHDKNLKKFAILVIDVDKFKFTNDKYGHRAGDEALKCLVQKINACIRESDSIGRFGGDEFVILLRYIYTEADIEAMIVRIFELVKISLVFNKQEIQNNLSIGISIFPDCSRNLEILIEQADLAMYEAKQIEESSYCFFHKNMISP